MRLHELFEASCPEVRLLSLLFRAVVPRPSCSCEVGRTQRPSLDSSSTQPGAPSVTELAHAEQRAFRDLMECLGSRFRPEVSREFMHVKLT